MLRVQIEYAPAHEPGGAGAAPNPFPPAISQAPTPPPEEDKAPETAPTPPAAPPAAVPAADEVTPRAGGAGEEPLVFAFHLEVVEARCLVTPAGGAVASPFVCVSLLGAPESLQKRHFFQLDHQASPRAPSAPPRPAPPCPPLPCPACSITTTRWNSRPGWRSPAICSLSLAVTMAWS